MERVSSRGIENGGGKIQLNLSALGREQQNNQSPEKKTLHANRSKKSKVKTVAIDETEANSMVHNWHSSNLINIDANNGTLDSIVGQDTSTHRIVATN